MDNGIQDEIDRRVEAVNAVYLVTPDIKEAISVIDTTARRHRQNGKPFCSLIVGQSGVGKTRLFERYMASQPEPEEGTTPVLMLSAPTPCDETALSNAIFEALSEPIIGTQPASLLGLRVGRALKRRAVRLLLLEEASHIVDNKGKVARIPYRMTDFIKTYLLDAEYAVPVVMNGVPVARRLYEINRQLLTRRHRTFELLPYDVEDEMSRDRFMLLLELYEVAAGFRVRRLCGDGQLARRVHLATAGVHFDISKLLVEATELGIRRGIDGFSAELLAEACARISDPVGKWVNPFLVATLPAQVPVDESRSTKLHKRSGGR